MNRTEALSRIKDNLNRLEARIQAACQRVGRNRSDVLLVAVTKYVSPETASLLLDLGIRDLGESRPQELWHKAAALPKDTRWHMIGHLQRNKIERTLPLVTLIHSVDSERLLAALSKESERIGRPTNVLLEVNLSREPNKTGFAANSVPLSQPAEAWPFPGVNPLGLMTMAAATDEPEKARATFAELRGLRDRIRAMATGVRSSFRELSMGMTHDFEVAIEEGATMVRIGSALFEGLIEEESEPSPP
jgi:pyridoxal phosphate enzyme (YggS family)